MCGDGEWVTISSCTGNYSCQANGDDIQCVSNGGASFDVMTTMNGWFMTNQTSYSKSQNEGTSPKITVTSAFYVDTHIIDGVTAVFNGKSGYNTQIVIDNLPAESGIGFVSFKYLPWSNTESATIEVSDGTTTKTLSVNSTEQYVQTATFTFNNPNAAQVTIKSVSTTGHSRVLIDDIRYTSAN